MEISGKQSTKSYGTQWQEINKVIWYAAAGNQRSHMVRSGKKSTKSFDTCLTSMKLLLLAPRPTSRRPPKRPIAAPALLPAGGVVRRVTFALLHTPRPRTLLVDHLAHHPSCAIGERRRISCGDRRRLCPRQWRCCGRQRRRGRIGSGGPR